MEEVEVTSEKIETGEVDMELTPGFFTVIDRSQFQGRMENVADVIEKEAGVQVRQQGGLGGFLHRVSLRGSSSDQVMIYLDGILLNDGSGGGVNLGNISLSDVGPSRCYRGTTPANFSKASIGGVVNIKTLKAEEGFKASASAGYGSFNTRQAIGLCQPQAGPVRLPRLGRLLGQRQRFRDLQRQRHPIQQGRRPLRKPEQRRVRARPTFLFKAGYDLGDKFRLDGMNQFFYKDQGLPPGTTAPDRRLPDHQAQHLHPPPEQGDNLTGLHLNAPADRLPLAGGGVRRPQRRHRLGQTAQHLQHRPLRGRLFRGMAHPVPHRAVSEPTFQYEDYQPEDKLGIDNRRSSDRTYFSVALQDSPVSVP